MKKRYTVAWSLLLVFSLYSLFGCEKKVSQTTKESGDASQVASEKMHKEAFIGSQSCRECHERFYELWAPSHHGLAMQPYTAELAKAKLAPQKDDIVIGDYRYLAETDADCGFVRETGPDGETRYEMVHALGGKNVYYFLTPMEKGRLQVLPVAYDVNRQEWYDTTKSAMRHFTDIEDEVLNWRESPLTFNTACYSCHVSQLSTNYDLKTDTYNSKWAEPGINCETCHGPASEHNRVCTEAKNKGEPAPKDLKIIRGGRDFSHEQNNATCSPCHAQMMPLSDAFQPGEKFFDHYDLVTLEDRDFYPDGRDLGENYTYTLWRMNKCVKAGQLDCLYCHTSSGRFIQKEDPNEACVACHKERAADLTEHTHHPEEGPGNRCIDCHMPMTEFARMKRSDHSALPPTPAATIAFGSPNACNICHSDKDAKWANRWVTKWHGPDYQESVLQRARLVDQARKQDWTKLEEMLAYIVNPDGEEVVKNGLIRLLWSCEDEHKWPVLVKALQDASPLVRASAADAFRGHLTPDTVGALLQATQDDYRLVRIRAAGALAALPAGSLDPAVKESLVRATGELEASLKTRPDDYSSHYNLGNFYMDRREYKKAIQSYETSIGIRPGVLPPLVNAAFAHVALGDPQGAEKSLKKGLEIDAESLAANINLGMLLGEQGRLAEAETYFHQALKTDNNSDAAAYNLCVIAGQDQARLKEAVRWCKKAAALRSEDSKYAYTLGYYQHQSGDDRSAVSTLRGAVEKQTAHAGSYGLLGEIYEQQGKIKKAVQLYNKALENPQLDRQAKAAFAQKIRMLSAQ